MISKPAQSHLLERVATRRTVVRSAAWTTAAVTVVVATPNIAAATPGFTAAGSAATSGSTRDGAKLNLKSTFTAGAQAITGLRVTVTLQNGSLASITTPPGWTSSGTAGNTATYTYTGTAAASTPVAFNPVATLTGNPAASVSTKIEFAWPSAGISDVTIPLAYTAPTAGIAADAVARKYNDAVDASLKHVEWKLTLTNGSQTLSDVKLDFAWSEDNAKTPATRFTVVSATRTWTTTLAGLIATLSGGALAPGEVVKITVDVANKSNSSGTLGVVVYSGTTNVTQLLSVGY